MATKNTVIFGYGSLINEESLRSTVPNAQNILPVLINGFRRDFNYHDAEGWKTSNLDLAGIPMCAVNVAPADDADRVNGVTFEVGNDYFDDLRRREIGYQLIETTAYDFRTGEELGTCALFSCGSADGEYLFGNPAQERYLQTCIDGAKGFGPEFHQAFLATTFINDKALSEMPELLW